MESLRFEGKAEEGFSPPLFPTDGRQISNVGFYDVSESEMVGAVETDTLFVHGSDSRGGSTWNKGETTNADATCR